MFTEKAEKWMFNCFYLVLIVGCICLCFSILDGTISHFVNLRSPVTEIILQRYDSYEKRLGLIEQDLEIVKNTAIFKKIKKH